MDAKINEHHGTNDDTQRSNSAGYKHWGFLLGVFLLYATLFLPSTLLAWYHGNVASTCPANGATLPGLNCDANGWTIFTPTPDPSFTTWAAQEGTGYAGTGTRIIYVSSSRGSDSGCSASNPPTGCTNDGSFVHPFATLYVGGQMVRNNSPDYVLADCNDTFTDGYGFANRYGGGPDNAHPAVYGIFDKNIYNASVAPDPDPTSCPHQVNVNITNAGSPQSLGGFFGGNGFKNIRFNHTALVGYNFYCQDRDPIGAGYNLTNAGAYQSGTGIQFTDDGALFENNTFRFCGGWNQTNTCLSCSGQQGFYSFTSNIYVRRNVIYGNYGDTVAPTIFGVGQGSAGSPALSVSFFENLIDQNGWSTDAGGSWPRNVNARNLYIQFYGVNGDPASLGFPLNFSGNTLAENTQGGEQWRPGFSNYEDNLLVQEPSTITNGLNDRPSSAGNWLRNVFIDESGFTGFVNGMQLNSRYIFGLNQSITGSTMNVNNNFFVNSPISQATGDYAIGAGVTVQGVAAGGFVGLTANGNVAYGFAAKATGATAFQFPTGGVVCTTQLLYGGCQVTAGGTGYTDKTISFTSTCSTNSSSCNGSGLVDGNNYITLVFPSNITSTIANTGNCYYQFSSGSDLSLHGPFACANLLGAPNTNETIFGTTWSAGMASLGGTIYYPWYAVKMTVTGAGTSSTCDSSNPPKMDLISVGGTIVFAGTGGSDNTWGPTSEEYDDPSNSCTTGDTITVTTGAGCGNAPNTTTCSFPAGGSGLAVKVDQASTISSQAFGCNPASNNVNDPTGTSCTAFTDPGRSIGSYYAQLAGTTANCTFTVSSIGTPATNIAVMTVSVPNSCTLTVGDAVTWAGQTKAAVIAGDSMHNASLCGTSCTGNGSNTGTYALNTVSNTGATGTTTISDWQSIQFVKAQRLNQKQSPWNPNLTSCKANTYVMNGFGVTNPCVP